MSTESRPQADAESLEIALARCLLPVSSLSSMLRVMQAALREVARSNEVTQRQFAQQTPPKLYTSAHLIEGELALRFTFADPSDSTPLPQLSVQVFTAFADQLAELVGNLAQRDLWGASVGGRKRQSYDSPVSRRLGELRRELRRFPRARVSFKDKAITFEGDRVEVGQGPSG